MQHVIPKQAFLDDLLARNAANLALVQETFAPLDRDARSAQPQPGEWCVDQCIQHLVLAFDMHLPMMSPERAKNENNEPAETFTRSWMARRKIYMNQFSPLTKVRTLPKVTPSEHFYPDVYAQFAAQKQRFAEIVEKSHQVDLQQRRWFLRISPINLGDYLSVFVAHDELHIDQAQRALAAYRQFAAA